jgi:drug/metabolite transporter (DMT)-like permease
MSAQAIGSIELAGDKAVAGCAAGMIEQRPTFLGERLGASGIVPDAIVDVVGVFLLVAPFNGMPL